jgi:hypothetical protein
LLGSASPDYFRRRLETRQNEVRLPEQPKMFQNLSGRTHQGRHALREYRIIGKEQRFSMSICRMSIYARVICDRRE